MSDSLWGVWIDNKLVAIYSDKGYGHIWSEGPWDEPTNRVYRGKGEYDFNPQLKLGMNILLYGLIHEGGLAHKVIDYSSGHNREISDTAE